MKFQDLTGCFHNILAFTSIQPAALDLPGQLFRSQFRKVPGSLVFFKQGAGDLVYLPVRALGRQNRGYQEFKGVVKFQSSTGSGVGLSKGFNYSGRFFFFIFNFKNK